MSQRFANSSVNERSFYHEENVNDTNLDEVVDEIKQKYDKEVPSEILFSQNTNTEESDDEESRLENAIDKLDKKSPKKSCACCSKARRVMKVSSFKKGQHISMAGQHFAKYVKVTKKLVRPYDHHAIIKEIIKVKGSWIKMVLIHFVKKDGKFQVVEETKPFDLRQKELYIIDYTFPKYSTDDIVARAERVFNKENESNDLQSNSVEESGETDTNMEDICNFESYNFFTRNCEHFATWCVVGEGESFQVQTVKQSIINGLYGLLGSSSIIVKGIIRVLFNTADEISLTLGKAAPPLVLSGVAAVYLIYCIVMTVLYKRDCSQGNMCGSCLKGKLLDLWLGFGAFGLTSAVSFIFFFFAMPLMGSGIGIPLTIIIILLSIAFQIAVPKLRKLISSPLSVEDVKVSSLDQIGIGDIISHRYYKIKHVGIVTEVDCFKNKIKTVHYALPALHRPRKIVEEDFDIDLKKSNIYILDCRPLSTFQTEDVVRRAKSRIGETKWDMCSNRSDHFSHWAKVQQKEDENIDETFDNVTKTSKVSLNIGKREIHCIDELKIGDVVQSTVIGKIDNTGILSSIEYLDVTNERIFEIEVYTYSFSRKITGKKYTVNLNKDNLYVKVYSSALCQSMDQRAKNARDMKDKKGSWFTTDGFIEHCIERR